MDILGIDLGTTHSVCGVFRDGAPELIPNSLGRTLTPSAVGVLDSGEILVGEAALELGLTRPERVATQFKRWMGTDHTVELAGTRYTPQELSSLVLRSLREDAAAAFGGDVRDAVITVPAYFNDLQREATRVAAELAGLRLRRMINEPTSAALAYGQHDASGDRRVIVFDLGGGTFDVTLLEIFEGTLEVRATAGDNRLGGEDFTARLVDLVLRRMDLVLETEEFRHPARVARLGAECERAKRAFGDEMAVEVRVPAEDGSFADGVDSVRVTRDDYLESVRGLLERLEGPLDRVLRDAGLDAEDPIHEVLLVGGATRMPFVRDVVDRRFAGAMRAEIDPDRVVARGACIQTALIEDDESVQELVLTDVCPFTLGVSISKWIGSRIKDGYYLPIVPRNTTIPVSREEIVSTVHDEQTEVEVRVFQGEARRAEDNLLLGTLKITDLPEGSAGRPISLRFTYDQNGALEVEAVVEDTGQRYATVFTHNAKSLTPTELAAARRAMQAVKFYPRDDVEHRRLLLFAEGAVGRVAPVHRAGLEEVVDRYEVALAGTDRDLFQSARQELLHKLSALDEVYDLPAADPPE